MPITKIKLQLYIHQCSQHVSIKNFISIFISLLIIQRQSDNQDIVKPKEAQYYCTIIINISTTQMFGKISYPQKQTSKQTPKFAVPTVPKTKLIEKKPKPQQKIVKEASSLKGSKFRVLNQLLYTRPSEDALKYFQEHQEDFQTYHEGFRQQASKWSQNPLNTIVVYLRKHYSDKNKLILDLGCGEAVLHQKMIQYAQVRSFDLVAKKDFVEVADIAHLPVDSSIADVCVFSLSLMGLNYIEFLQEAARVLKPNGQLLISQVQSRCKKWANFITMVESLGFECKANKTNQYFRILYFGVNVNNKRRLKIEGQFKQLKQFSTQILGSCLYKKR